MPKTARAILQMPPATVVAIEKLGADLAVARLRRKESLKTWAQRMGVSVPTLQRLEAGDPGVALALWPQHCGSYSAMAHWRSWPPPS